MFVKDFNLNNVPDWAEFIFKAGDITYYGGKRGYTNTNLELPFYKWIEKSQLPFWRANSQPIIRQLEND